MVPEEFVLIEVSAEELESGLWGAYNTYSIKRCKGEYRMQGVLDTIERIGWFGMEVLGVLLGQSPDLKAAVWYDGWSKYPGGRLDKYHSKIGTA